MDSKEKILKQIANILMLYTYSIEDNGLLKGKTGAMLYLFLYAKYSGNKAYFAFATELMNGLLKSTANAPTSFEDGVAGLGWCIRSLLVSGVVEGRTNAMLADIDYRLLEEMTKNNWSESWNELIYFVYRIQDFDKEDGKRFCEMIQSYLLFNLRDNTFLYTKAREAAVMYFVNACNTAFSVTEISSNIKEILVYNVTSPVIAYNFFDIEQIAHKRIAQFINSNIQSIIINRNVISKEFDIEWLANYVDNVQSAISQGNLNFSEGLSGLGTFLLSNLLKI